jgi:hypothetical protein
MTSNREVVRNNVILYQFYLGAMNGKLTLISRIVRCEAHLSGRLSQNRPNKRDFQSIIPRATTAFDITFNLHQTSVSFLQQNPSRKTK